MPLVHSIDCFIVVPASLLFKLCTMTFASQEEGEGGVPVELFSDPHGVHRDSLEMWLDFLGHYPRSPQLLINKDYPIIVGLEQVRWYSFMIQLIRSGGNLICSSVQVVVSYPAH